MKYLSKEPMVFLPPRIPQAVTDCRHEHGKTFNGHVWKCNDCGKVLKG